MDLVFSVNSQTQDLRYGDPATGNLATIQQLAFRCHRLVVLPGQRHVYVTGNKVVSGVPHAWLAVFDTCSNTVVKELDLGPGFAGQTAVPGGVNGIRAYVAVSQAVGQNDTGPAGGTNRIEVLNIIDPADPILLTPAFQIPGTPYGTLHVIWSVQRNKIYTTHRGSGRLYSIDPFSSSVQFETAISGQPTGMALSRNGLVLYVGSRLTGLVVGYGISGAQISSGAGVVLPEGKSGSAIYLAVDAQDRVIATSAQRLDATNLNTNPVPGRVYVIDPLLPNPAVPKMVDTQGTWLGQPAPTPDGTRVFVPRGDQNDLAEVDPAPNPPVVAANLIQVGHIPTDAVAVNHVAGQTLEATPAAVQGNCNAPQQVTIRAYDACGSEIQGVAIQPVAAGSGVAVSPGQQNTPATFDLQCQSHGSATVSFSTTSFPFTSIPVDVSCQCPQDYCVEFFAPNSPITPNTLGGIISVSIINPGVFQGPQVFGNQLFLRHGTVRFVMPPQTPVGNLIVNYTRHDSQSQPEVVTVTHAAGTAAVSNSAVGLAKGDHQIICPFQGITEWTIAGGAETRIGQICFEAQPGLPLPSAN